jgi:hypothetical protein
MSDANQIGRIEAREDPSDGLTKHEAAHSERFEVLMKLLFNCVDLNHSLVFHMTKESNMCAGG